jgi:hypothetical protein
MLEGEDANNRADKQCRDRSGGDELALFELLYCPVCELLTDDHEGDQRRSCKNVV